MKRIAFTVLIAMGGACAKGEPHAAEGHDEAGESGHASETGDDLEFDDDPDHSDGESHDGGEEDESGAGAQIKEGVAEARARLDTQRLDVDRRKADVDAATAELDKRLKSIAELERRLDERLGAGATARQRRTQRIAVLAKLILAMPPQAGAAMVAEMTDADAQALILQMSQESDRKASKLLSAMPGLRAAELGQLYLDEDPNTVDTPPAAAADGGTAPDPAQPEGAP